MHFHVKVSMHMRVCMWKPEDQTKMSLLRYCTLVMTYHVSQLGVKLAGNKHQVSICLFLPNTTITNVEHMPTVFHIGSKAKTQAPLVAQHEFNLI